jgi:hypothetical protein
LVVLEVVEEHRTVVVAVASVEVDVADTHTHTFAVAVVVVDKQVSWHRIEKVDRTEQVWERERQLEEGPKRNLGIGTRRMAYCCKRMFVVAVVREAAEEIQRTIHPTIHPSILTSSYCTVVVHTMRLVVAERHLVGVVQKMMNWTHTAAAVQDNLEVVEAVEVVSDHNRS